MPEIKFNGRTPRLEFTEKFRERSIEDQLEYMEKLAGSQNEAIGLMQKEKDALAGELRVVKAQLQNAETALIIQKNITRDALTKQNEDSQQTAQRIRELETRVKAQNLVIEGKHGNNH